MHSALPWPLSTRFPMFVRRPAFHAKTERMSHSNKGREYFRIKTVQYCLKEACVEHTIKYYVCAWHHLLCCVYACAGQPEPYVLVLKMFSLHVTQQQTGTWNLRASVWSETSGPRACSGKGGAKCILHQYSREVRARLYLCSPMYVRVPRQYFMQLSNSRSSLALQHHDSVTDYKKYQYQ